MNSSVQGPFRKSLKCCLDVVSNNVLGAEGEELEMAIFDIRRSHFMAPMDREACIELLEEDKLPEGGDAVGLLQSWMKDLQATHEEGGYKVGVANPALSHRSEDGSRGGVHGDDFAVVGSLTSCIGPDGKDFVWQVLHARVASTWVWKSV